MLKNNIARMNLYHFLVRCHTDNLDWGKKHALGASSISARSLKEAKVLMSERVPGNWEYCHMHLGPNTFLHHLIDWERR